MTLWLQSGYNSAPEQTKNKSEYWRDGVDHVQTHLHTAVGVVCLRLGQSRHAVVAIAQDLNSAAVVFLEWKKKKHSNKENNMFNGLF